MARITMDFSPEIPDSSVGGFPNSSVDKESACNAGDLDLIPGLGRFPGEGNSYPLQYSGQENFCSPWGHKELDTTERFLLSYLKSCKQEKSELNVNEKREKAN